MVTKTAYLPFNAQHLDTWEKEGGVLIEDFFSPNEVQAVAADFARVFDNTITRDKPGKIPAKATSPDKPPSFHPKQFKNFAAIPFDCSPALNLIGVHPALMAFARAALKTPNIHLYQCQAWAKFTGEADYNQPLHCDFANHTLTVPSENAAKNSVTILCYFSDVSEAHGPMHYVTRTDSAAVAGPEAAFSADPDLQEKLLPLCRSSAAPAGSIFPYGIDVYHRGTNLTASKGHRYAVMACFKAAGNDRIGYHAWPFHHTQPWANIFDYATPDQLTCFGVAPPGDAFWTQVSLDRAQVRYPNWDLTPYRVAIHKP